MLKTIKSKFVFYSILLIILSIGIPNYFLIRQFQINFRERSETYLNSAVDMILYNLKSSMKGNYSKNIQELIDSTILNENVQHIRIFNSDGRILYSSEHQYINKNIRIVAPEHVDSNFNKIEGRKTSLMDNKHAFIALLAIKNENACHSCHDASQPVIAYMDVDIHLTSAERNFSTGVQHYVYLGILLIILLTFGLIVLFNYFINKPLLEINGAIDKLEKGDFIARLPIEHNDEFGVINNHFNRMVNEMDNSRKEIEQLHIEELRRADKMVTLGEIAAAMAHDINNYSAIIMTRADFLQMEAENNSFMKKFKEELDVIIEQVHKISKTTGFILKNAKRVSSEFHDLDLIQLTNSTLDNFDPLFKKNHISVDSNFIDDKVIIHGNIVQIEQVIMNLLNNALDAMESGGRISVTIKKDESGRVEFIIVDNGKGISKENLERIYSPFFTTKTGEKGTGLGLYIIKNICKNHGAEILCESAINNGTSFTIRFKSAGGEEK